MKVCTKCHIEKPLAEFYSKGFRSGYRRFASRCKECVKEDRKTLTPDSRSKKNAHMAGYRATHKAQITAYGVGKGAPIRATYEAKYRDSHPEMMAIKYTAKRIKKKLPKLSRKKATLYRRSLKQRKCYYCGESKGVFHTDHYMPLAKGGTDHWFNLMRACASCNLRKHDKLGTEFEADNGTTVAPRHSSSVKSGVRR